MPQVFLGQAATAHASILLRFRRSAMFIVSARPNTLPSSSRSAMSIVTPRPNIPPSSVGATCSAPTGSRLAPVFYLSCRVNEFVWPSVSQTSSVSVSRIILDRPTLPTAAEFVLSHGTLFVIVAQHTPFVIFHFPS